MKKLCFFVIHLFLLHGLFQPAIAQTGQATISAVVKDSSAQKALSFVTVELFKGAQFTQPVKTSYSNDKGKFSLAAVDTGSYTLVLSHTGFAEKRLTFHVSAGQQQDLGTIALTPAAASMTGAAQGL